MILPSELYKAFTHLYPRLSYTYDITERVAREYLEKNPLVADCCDLKFATNMFRNYLGV